MEQPEVRGKKGAAQLPSTRPFQQPWLGWTRLASLSSQRSGEGACVARVHAIFEWRPLNCAPASNHAGIFALQLVQAILRSETG